MRYRSLISCSVLRITIYSFGFIAVSDGLTISSLHNPTIRRMLKLRDNHARRREKVVLVDGIREIERALDAGLVPQSIFIGSNENSDFLQLTERCPAAIVRVSDAVLQKIAFGQNHRDAVGLFAEPQRTLAELTLSVMPIVIVLDALEKPGNVGAVFRSADAIGADAVVICEGACDLFNPSIIRASLGTVFTMPCAQADRASTISWIAAQGMSTVMARVDAAVSYWDVDFCQPVAIVVGSESQGLGDQWRVSKNSSPRLPHGSHEVQIPMCGSADSLNASVSAALLMFEARRQRLKTN